MKSILTTTLVLAAFHCNGQIITTFAGNGIAANTGDGGPATAASVDYPTGGVFDKNGNYYFTLGTVGNGVRMVSSDGVISRVAGTGSGGFSGDGGPATNALLKTAQTVAIDSTGNILIADSENGRIRRVDISTGIITTVAGTGVSGFNGDGSALSTNITPNNLCYDKIGNLYFSEVTRIRKLDKFGNIITIAGNGASGFGGNNVPATSVPVNAFGLCFDQANNLYFADDYGRIYKIDGSGNMFYHAGNGLGGYSGDNGSATLAGMRPTYIKIDKAGNMFVGESAMSRVRMINSTGIITTVVGTGVNGYNGDEIPATSAQLRFPGGIALDSCGNLYIADSHDYRIRKISFNPDCLPISVQEVQGNESINVTLHPNPATETLTITAGVEIETVAILNAVGQCVARSFDRAHDDKLRTSGKQLSVDVGGLPPGVYMVRVNEVYAGKMVKQ
jgi:trimeric autotransporter adhesin